MSGAPLVELRGIVKRFPGLVANDRVAGGELTMDSGNQIGRAHV